MVKKLTKHGNSLALVIDRAVLNLLKIGTDTHTERFVTVSRVIWRAER